jgi:hypothetical protein
MYADQEIQPSFIITAELVPDVQPEYVLQGEEKEETPRRV